MCIKDFLLIVSHYEAERPSPTIFLKACELLGVNHDDAIHVRDDRINDVWVPEHVVTLGFGESKFIGN